MVKRRPASPFSPRRTLFRTSASAFPARCASTHPAAIVLPPATAFERSALDWNFFSPSLRKPFLSLASDIFCVCAALELRRSALSRRLTPPIIESKSKSNTSADMVKMLAPGFRSRRATPFIRFAVVAGLFLFAFWTLSSRTPSINIPTRQPVNVKPFGNSKPSVRHSASRPCCHVLTTAPGPETRIRPWREGRPPHR